MTTIKQRIQLLPAALPVCRTTCRAAFTSLGHTSLRHARRSCALKTTPLSIRRSTTVVVRASNEGDTDSKRPVEFGYSRKDIILIGTGIIAFGYALYYGLQATGMEPGMAGNFVQLGVVLAMCIGWVSTYFWRVANKQMTYVKQLEDYEEAVMQKRLEEMPESELEQLTQEIEERKQRKQGQKQ